MNHNHTNLFPLILLLGIALPMYASGAQADECPLRMTVQIEPKGIHVYEAVPITVVFQNAGDKEFPVHFHAFRMDRGVGTVEVRDPAGAIHVFRQPRCGESVYEAHEAYWPVKPGDEYRISFLLACSDASVSDQNPIFTKPGKYTITVEYDDRAADAGSHPDIDFKRTDYPSVHLKSEPVVIEVLDAPATERRALKLVKGLQPPVMLYEPNLIPTSPHYEDAREKLREIASVKESSIYANYARYSLAGRYVVRARAAEGAPHYYDYDEEVKAAREMLDAIDTKGFTLADRVEKLRAELERIIKGHKSTKAAQKP